MEQSTIAAAHDVKTVNAASALKMERLSEPAIVTGNADTRKLMFSRKSGEICVITVEEGYGDRLAFLHVEVSQDPKYQADQDVWQILFNDKPFMDFATRGLAMQAFDDANTLLTATFTATEICEKRPERSIWKEVAKICAVLVVTAFAIGMALRGAATLLPTHTEKLVQATKDTERATLFQPEFGPRQIPPEFVPQIPPEFVPMPQPVETTIPHMVPHSNAVTQDAETSQLNTLRPGHKPIH